MGAQIIADSDLLSVKLVEAVNLRPLNSQTSHLPVISTVLLHTEKFDRDDLTYTQKQLIDSIAAAGGANAEVEFPYSSNDVMNAILSVLRRRRLVEGSYRDLRTARQVEYPYISLFESEAERRGKLMNGDGDDYNDDAGNDGHEDTSSTCPCDEFDDWTPCSSILSERGANMRHQMTETVTDSDDSSQRVDDDDADADEAALRKEATARRAVDRRIVRELDARLECPGHVKSDFSDVLSIGETTESSHGRRRRFRSIEQSAAQQHEASVDIMATNQRPNWGLGTSCFSRSMLNMCWC